MTDDGWMEHSACRAAVKAGVAAPDDWFPSFPAKPDRLALAKRICEACPVKDDCRAHAERNAEVGVWGGIAFGHRSNRSVERTCSECGTVFPAPPVSGRPRETCSAPCAKARHDRQRNEWAAARGVDVGASKAAGHGRISTYQKAGCRCLACRRAAREARARYRRPTPVRRLTVVPGSGDAQKSTRNDVWGVA